MLRQQPVADEGANNADEQIADEPESAPAHDLAGRSAGNKADQQNDQQTFIREMHRAASKTAVADRPGVLRLYERRSASGRIES